MSQNNFKQLLPQSYPNFKMTSTEDLEKRIKNLEKEVQHLKAALQYQTKNKKRPVSYTHLTLPTTLLV